MTSRNNIEALAEAIIKEAAQSLAQISDPSTVKRMYEAAEMSGDPAENFDNWLPLRLAGTNRYYDYTLAELDVLRNTCRSICDTNEIAKNVQSHYRDFVVGKHIQIDIVPSDFGEDPMKLAQTKKDSQVRKMLENWKMFAQANNFDARCRNWVNRAHKDGEVIHWLFNADIPRVRFIDPTYIKSPSSEVPYGIKYVQDDAETPETFYYQPYGKTDYQQIPATSILFDKRNVDFGAPRGIPSYWACLSNLRRLEKILVNSSVLAAVQAAITMVRKHQSATAAKVTAMVNKQSDGVQRTDSAGRTVVSRRINPGTILDAPAGTEYEFPSHGINASAFTELAKHELRHIAANFTLPVSWLMADEPTEPLNPGSPTIAMFETEQETMFEHTDTMFWMVQGMMGVNVERNILKYDLLFNGKRLAVGKALDEARVDEILTRVGAQSPQTTASKHGNNWAQERAGTIKHRDTRQPGEVMPGDAGNTNTADTAASTSNGGDGLSKKNGNGQRGADGSGGNNG